MTTRREQFTLMTLEAAIKVAVERDLVEVLPSIEMPGAQILRLTGLGKQTAQELDRDECVK